MSAPTIAPGQLNHALLVQSAVSGSTASRNVATYCFASAGDLHLAMSLSLSVYLPCQQRSEFLEVLEYLCATTM